MNCPDWSNPLHDYVDGELSRADAQAFEAHLTTCAECRHALASLRALRTATAALDREIAPARDLWSGISDEVERAIPGALGQRPAFANATAATPPRSSLSWFLPFAVAASIAGLFFAAEHNLPARRGPAWKVSSVLGAPRIDTRAIDGTGQMHIGQWLETDHASRARVEVGSIGQVNVEPNSRLRLIDASATDHRLELARGELHALIWAPPRLFFVNTSAATAVDLGCAYDLKVADNGDGELRVTSGYVALEHDGREAIIPAGLVCRTRPGAGPGTPFDPTAPAALRDALERFDFSGKAGRPAALADVLKQARAEDYVMLWHLLSRAPSSAQRGEVFDVLAQHHAPPAGVTRTGIVADNAAMREAWAGELGLRSFAKRL
jgi:hypothetical protein